jgi:hypothetical protein
VRLLEGGTTGRSGSGTPPPVPKVRYVGNHPEYDLTLDGQTIGRVRAYEKRYNLRRVYVDRGWVATSLDGQHTAGSDHTDTRRSAVAGLLDAMGLEGTP